VSYKDLTGNRYGRLVVIERVANRKKLRTWLCLCDCGNTHTTAGKCLVSGDTQSCGCLQKERTADFNRTRIDRLAERGKKKDHPLFVTWLDMRRRCTKPWMHSYKYYGAKGVSVCEQWTNDFWAFIDHIGEPPGEGYTIDRIDPYGNYEPGNVRWATHKEQANNKRRNKA